MFISGLTRVTTRCESIHSMTEDETSPLMLVQYAKKGVSYIIPDFAGRSEVSTILKYDLDQY